MALIKSISGFRGTIGGTPGTNLTPVDIVECTAGYGQWLLAQNPKPKVIIGRDARISGEMVNQLVCQTLIAMGIDIIDLGLSTTPTVEVAVPIENATGGIILTASHNPKQWNALKLLNHKGEFISADDGREILDLVAQSKFEFAGVDSFGEYREDSSYIDKHLKMIFDLPEVNVSLIQSRKWKVVVDCINSTGAISVVPMLEKMGCEVISLFDDLSGDFQHNPEPLESHLQDLSQAVVREKADFGITVDPDVDRLAFMMDNGKLFGEENTLVVVADYLLGQHKGPAVSNLSSSRALKDICLKHGVEYFASAVGEVNVVTKMKEVDAVIGGEGNGGIIYPGLHYGRDALVGIGLFLSHFANADQSLSEFRGSYPEYSMIKDKIKLEPGLDLDPILGSLNQKYKDYPLNTIDGLKINMEDRWVHLRKSNTEPIIRIYAEAPSTQEARKLVDDIKSAILELA
ncbi:MAG: phosphoglucosamine mutase [Saprospiraceae bacterium]|nr:phosphoglucosamine mutase [Saprospiraceae bacterium]